MGKGEKAAGLLSRCRGGAVWEGNEATLRVIAGACAWTVLPAPAGR
jgi:hypothetical protein